MPVIRIDPRRERLERRSDKLLARAIQMMKRRRFKIPQVDRLAIETHMKIESMEQELISLKNKFDELRRRVEKLESKPSGLDTQTSVSFTVANLATNSTEVKE